MSKRFFRPESVRFLRLGKKKKKLRKWRRCRGKSNKIRLNRAGYPCAPKVGFKTPRKEIGKIKGKTLKLVHNLRELEALSKNDAAILARVGAKKKLELMKKADELKITIVNVGGKK